MVAIRKAKIQNSESFKTGWDFNSWQPNSDPFWIFPISKWFVGQIHSCFCVIDWIFPCCSWAALWFSFGWWICLRALQPSPYRRNGSFSIPRALLSLYPGQKGFVPSHPEKKGVRRWGNHSLVAAGPFGDISCFGVDSQHRLSYSLTLGF